MGVRVGGIDVGVAVGGADVGVAVGGAGVGVAVGGTGVGVAVGGADVGMAVGGTGVGVAVGGIAVGAPQALRNSMVNVRVVISRSDSWRLIAFSPSRCWSGTATCNTAYHGMLVENQRATCVLLVSKAASLLTQIMGKLHGTIWITIRFRTVLLKHSH